MGGQGVRREGTCAGACRMAAPHRMADNSPWVNKASYLLRAPLASSCGGLCVPGEDPDSQGNSRCVGLQKEVPV